MLRKLISIILITSVLSLILIIELQIVNFFLKLFKWRLGYLYHSSLWIEGIYTLIVVLFILLISLFFRGVKTKKNTLRVGMITGSIAFSFCFLSWMLFKFSLDPAPLILLGIPTFSLGFLFSVFYKLLNKKPLFSENFY